MQQGSPKRNPESKAAFESNQKLAILEFARISKSQVFPSLIAVCSFWFISVSRQSGASPLWNWTGITNFPERAKLYHGCDCGPGNFFFHWLDAPVEWSQSYAHTFFHGERDQSFCCRSLRMAGEV